MQKRTTNIDNTKKNIFFIITILLATINYDAVFSKKGPGAKCNQAYTNCVLGLQTQTKIIHLSSKWLSNNNYLKN
ncbi:MAG: hypothetical protein ABJC98_15865 [Bacteroidota bacterium]